MPDKEQQKNQDLLRAVMSARPPRIVRSPCSEVQEDWLKLSPKVRKELTEILDMLDK